MDHDDRGGIAGAIRGAFATAWDEIDRAAMVPLSESDVVERALLFGDAVGPVRCSTHQDGRYQCIVATSSGRRAYDPIKPGAGRGGGSRNTTRRRWDRRSRQP